MDRITDILVIVDPTAADQPAVAKAAILARHIKASVELLACDTKSSYELRLARNLAQSTQCEPVNLQVWLESLAVPLREQGIDVRTSAITGDPLHEALLEWMHNSPADLVIKDTHHHSLIHRTFIGNTDWHLIQDCRLPLLLVKPTRWHEPPAFAAAIDPHHVNNQEALLDQRIMSCMLMLAQPMQARIHAVHAYFPAAIAAAAAGCRAPNMLAITPDILAAEKELHRWKIKSLLTPYGIPEECLHVDMGVPSDYLPDVAKQYRIDVMVMGALSRSRIKQAILGSTAERVLEYLPCDVLVIKSAKFGEHLPF